MSGSGWNEIVVEGRFVVSIEAQWFVAELDSSAREDWETKNGGIELPRYYVNLLSDNE